MRAIKKIAKQQSETKLSVVRTIADIFITIKTAKTLNDDDVWGGKQREI